MAKTTIEWATDVWNPTSGCTKVSEGCRNCYAERIAERFWKDRKFTDVRCHPERLDQPLHWRKPRRVFVDSMSDLFHEDVPFNFIDQVFMRMYMAEEHTFMILTKRSQRMFDYMTRCTNGGFHTHEIIRIESRMRFLMESKKFVWPLPNVWLGVSVENQAAADERIPLLLKTPAAVRFVSCEPLLEEVDLTHDLDGYRGEEESIANTINWVICGGESGPDARPMHPDWVRSLRDQCQDAGVPLFFKQWGEWGLPIINKLGGGVMMKMGKKAAGRLLDGQEWNEVPETTPPPAPPYQRWRGGGKKER